VVITAAPVSTAPSSSASVSTVSIPRQSRQPVPAASPAPRDHLVTTLDRGMFVHASCVLCAWDGPGRRAYASADRDAAAHLLT
jgi:hypothetical protein